MTTPRTFQVSPPPGYTLPILIGLFVLPLIGLGIAIVTGGESTDLREMWPAALILAASFALVLYAFHRRAVSLHEGILVIRAGLHTRKVAASALDLDRARVIDLREHTQLRPILQTSGMALPGFHAGSFRMRDRFKKGFYVLTDQQRVLWLPQHDGFNLLLSLDQPQQLLDALRTVAQPRHAR